MDVCASASVGRAPYTRRTHLQGDLMDMANPTFWWVAAGVVVIAELASGTFYLLMIAVGLVAAAIASHLGLGVATQLIVGAVVGVVATASWHSYRTRRLGGIDVPPTRENRDVNLDIGERVKVDAWGHDRTARVFYRGSAWTARLAPGASPLAGEHVVSAVEGNWLVLTPAVPI